MSYDIDLYHMSATISAILYKSSNSDGSGLGRLKYQFMEEIHIDNLTGWAGDLQTVIYDSALYEKKTGIKFSYTFSNSLGDESSKFGMLDLNADADAYNLTHEILSNNNHTFEEVLSNYYSDGIKTRYSDFKMNCLQGDISVIRTYTNMKYLGIITWPIYNYSVEDDDYIEKHVIISDEMAKESSEIFMHYIDSLISFE